MYNDIMLFLKSKLNSSTTAADIGEIPPSFSYSSDPFSLGVLTFDGYVIDTYRKTFTVELEENIYNVYPLEFDQWMSTNIQIIVTDGEGNYYNQNICGADLIFNEYNIGYDYFSIDCNGIIFPEGKTYTAYVTIDFYYD